jgi:hypothetical protein
VTGVEINTTYRGNEVHILGYGFRLGETELERTVEENRVARERRAEAMIDQLARVGYEISMEAVRAEAGPRAALGRPHVAKALVRAGFVSDVDAAFRNVLSAGRPGYVPSSHITPQRAVAAVVRASSTTSSTPASSGSRSSTRPTSRLRSPISAPAHSSLAS